MNECRKARHSTSLQLKKNVIIAVNNVVHARIVCKSINHYFLLRTFQNANCIR